MDYLDDLDDAAEGSPSAPLQTSPSSALPVASAPVSSANEARCNAIPFAHVCEVFDKVERTSGTAKKLGAVFSSDLNSRVGNGSLFPLLRLLLPQVDNERGKYGLKQASIVKLYISSLNLSETSEDARRLKACVEPSSRVDNKQPTDFATVLADVLKTRVRAEPSTSSVGEINSLLTELASASTSKDKEHILRTKILMKLSPTEQKWLMRIIFQDLKIGLSDGNVLGALSSDARDRFNECSSLRIVCGEFASGLSPFMIYSPMLAGKPFNQKQGQIRFAEEKMHGHPFVMDVKLDGERMSCQTNGAEVRMYTRNGNDYTANYQSLAADMLTALRGYSAMLDGEVLAFDRATNDFSVFGSNRTVGKVDNYMASDGNWLIYVAFDLLYLSGSDALDIVNRHIHSYNSSFVPQFASSGVAANYTVLPLQSGGELTKLPLAVRRAVLKEVLVLKQNRIELVKHETVLSTKLNERLEQLGSFFDKSFVNGEEGVVVKDLTSRYALGKSSKGLNFWVKLKPDYGDEITLIDVVVLGAYFGEGTGFRGQGLTSFLCGVREGEGSDVYVPFCKVGSGFSYEALKDIRKRLESCTKSPIAAPSHLRPWSYSKKDEPHRYLPLDQCFVLEMKCFELVPSEQYPAGVTARFPRCTRLRPDKDISDVETMAYIHNLLKVGMRTGDGSNSTNANKRRTPMKAAQPSKRFVGARVDEAFTLTSLAAEEVTGEVFSGAVFYVESFPDDFELADSIEGSGLTKYDKTSVSRLIAGNQGAVVANPVSGCRIIAGTKVPFSLKALMLKEEYDVLHFSYIIDCIRSNTLLEPKLRHYKGFSKATKAHRAASTDKYGASLIYDMDVLDVKAVVQRMQGDRPVADVPPSWKLSFISFDEDLREVVHQLNPLFGVGVVVYVDMYESLTASERIIDEQASLSFDATLLSFYGANVSATLEAEVTHVLVNPSNMKRGSAIRHVLQSFRIGEQASPEKRIVNSEWIRDCLLANRLVFYPGSAHDAKTVVWG